MWKSCPKHVKLATGCLVTVYGESSLRAFLRMDWSDLYHYVALVPSVAIACFIIGMIYCGENWARWVFVIYSACWLVTLGASFEGGIESIDPRASGMLWRVTLTIVAIFLLFTNSANSWFRLPSRARYRASQN